MNQTYGYYFEIIVIIYKIVLKNQAIYLLLMHVKTLINMHLLIIVSYISISFFLTMKSVEEPVT